MTKRTDKPNNDKQAKHEGRDHIDLGKDARVEVDAFKGDSQFNQVKEADEKTSNVHGRKAQSDSHADSKATEGRSLPLDAGKSSKQSEIPAGATRLKDAGQEDEMEYIDGLGYVFRTKKQGVQAQKDARNAYDKQKARSQKQEPENEEE